MHDVGSRYRALDNFTQEDARLQFLRILRTLPYGAFFTPDSKLHDKNNESPHQSLRCCGVKACPGSAKPNSGNARLWIPCCFSRMSHESSEAHRAWTEWQRRAVWRYVSFEPLHYFAPQPL